MSSNKQEKKKKKVGDEDEAPLRTKVREFVEGKFITALMTITTLFALFGDDFRLWFTNKWGRSLLLRPIMRCFCVVCTWITVEFLCSRWLQVLLLLLLARPGGYSQFDCWHLMASRFDLRGSRLAISSCSSGRSSRGDRCFRRKQGSVLENY